jgi:phenylacetic acid degradation operon negative regulatory protein
MEFRPFFHHPDLSMPVIRRHLGQELLELMFGLGEVLATRGRSLLLSECCPTRTAYHAAVYRLRKAGLIADCDVLGGRRVLELTDDGRSRLPDSCRPNRFWKRKWNRLWYVLVYDVPESERPYRNALREFLRRMRMGCLQRSVWVTPRDIRPEYDDLVHAAGVDAVSYLLESATVLGRNPQDIVCSAWDFERLGEIQSWYCDVYAENLGRLLEGKHAPSVLVTFAREEMSAYLSAMAEDPLLPRELWPDGYRGQEVCTLHRRLVKEIGKRA